MVRSPAFHYLVLMIFLVDGYLETTSTPPIKRRENRERVTHQSFVGCRTKGGLPNPYRFLSARSVKCSFPGRLSYPCGIAPTWRVSFFQCIPTYYIRVRMSNASFRLSMKYTARPSLIARYDWARALLCFFSIRSARALASGH